MSVFVFDQSCNQAFNPSFTYYWNMVYTNSLRNRLQNKHIVNTLSEAEKLLPNIVQDVILHHHHCMSNMVSVYRRSPDMSKFPKIDFLEKGTTQSCFINKSLQLTPPFASFRHVVFIWYRKNCIFKQEHHQIGLNKELFTICKVTLVGSEVVKETVQRIYM